MTGLLDGLRSWLGGRFGAGGEQADEEGAETTASNDRDGGSASAVAHRDDRPLETPATLDPSPPAGEPDGSPPADGRDAATADRDPGRVEIPDAEGGDAVSVPEAERTDAGGSGAPTDAGDGSGAGEGEASDPAAAEDADAFACSVCGTRAEDPSGGCPLCGSTDVRPVSGPSGGDSAEIGQGRTAVSEADDEAVDRLRDVRGGGE
ncbi:hydrogenase maturation nickel metallochaperone HypA [Haloplanus halophilus]|uniref:hydrogenase maturation nickel metallochaperone HypA n=1 Tax=Haloplanus halophilus TaxID=2949993 RepID=UPI00203F777D|nr:hydrogenase maturation nickel metallochaperone HypA [Haloplanus sp. GDY1]